MTESRQFVELNKFGETVHAAASSASSFTSAPTVHSGSQRRHASQENELSDTIVSSENFFGNIQAMVANMKAEVGSLKKKIDQLDKFVETYKQQQQQQARSSDDRSGSFPMRELEPKSCFPVGQGKLPFIMILGKRFSGVTLAMLEFVRKSRDRFSRLLVFSDDQVWAGVVPQHSLIRDSTPEIVDQMLQRLFEMQKRRIANGTAEDVLVVFDGVMSLAISSLPSVVACCKKGKHFRVGTLASAQYFNDFSPVLRQNADYVLTASELAKPVQKKMYMEWFNVIQRESHFLQLLDHFTKNYGFLVACMRTASINVQDRVFWFRAPNLKADFRAGSDAFWAAKDFFYDVVEAPTATAAPTPTPATSVVTVAAAKVSNRLEDRQLHKVQKSANQTESISIRELDEQKCFPSEELRLPFILFLGHRYAGVTCAMLSFVRETRPRFSRLLVFSNDPEWIGTVPSHSLIRDSTPAMIDQMLQRLFEMQQRRINDGTVEDVLVVFDGVMTRQVGELPSVMACCKNGRHYRVGTLASAPYFNDFSPILRQNVDYVLTASEFAKPILHKMFLEWFAAIRREEYFIQLLEHYTQNHGFLVACQSTKSNNIQDRVFWFRAQNVKAAFRAGSDAFWAAKDFFFEAVTPAPAAAAAAAALAPSVTASPVSVVLSELPQLNGSSCFTTPQGYRGHPFMVVAGSRNCGKTTAMLALATCAEAKLTVFGVEEVWGKLVPAGSWIPYGSVAQIDRVLTQLIAEQKIRCAQGTAENQLVIFDSGSVTPEVAALKSVQECCFHGHRIKVSSIMSMQCMQTLPPSIRQQADFVLTRQPFSLPERSRLWKEWFSMIPHFHQFNRILDRASSDFGFLAANLRAPDLADNVFEFRAPAFVPPESAVTATSVLPITTTTLETVFTFASPSASLPLSDILPCERSTSISSGTASSPNWSSDDEDWHAASAAAK